MNTITPQALGALIKRTGARKAQSKQGNFYNYHTEGYTLTRQYGGRYTVEYHGRLQMARRTEAEWQAISERRNEAFRLIAEALTAKGITYELQDETLWINLENKEVA